MKTEQDKEQKKQWRSCARWEHKHGFQDDLTTDDHDTKEQAQAICDMLRRDGLGGEHCHFPLDTWVEKLPEQRPDHPQIQSDKTREINTWTYQHEKKIGFALAKLAASEIDLSVAAHGIQGELEQIKEAVSNPLREEVEVYKKRSGELWDQLTAKDATIEELKREAGEVHSAVLSLRDNDIRPLIARFKSQCAEIGELKQQLTTANATIEELRREPSRQRRRKCPVSLRRLPPR